MRAGYDWQFGNIVVGALAEYTVNNAQDSVTGLLDHPGFLHLHPRAGEHGGRPSWRLGYAAGQRP